MAEAGRDSGWRLAAAAVSTLRRRSTHHAARAPRGCCYGSALPPGCPLPRLHPNVPGNSCCKRNLATRRHGVPALSAAAGGAPNSNSAGWCCIAPCILNRLCASSATAAASQDAWPGLGGRTAERVLAPRASAMEAETRAATPGSAVSRRRADSRSVPTALSPQRHRRRLPAALPHRSAANPPPPHFGVGLCTRRPAIACGKTFKS